MLWVAVCIINAFKNPLVNDFVFLQVIFNLTTLLSVISAMRT